MYLGQRHPLKAKMLWKIFSKLEARSALPVVIPGAWTLTFRRACAANIMTLPSLSFSRGRILPSIVLEPPRLRDTRWNGGTGKFSEWMHVQQTGPIVCAEDGASASEDERMCWGRRHRDTSHQLLNTPNSLCRSHAVKKYVQESQMLLVTIN